MTCEQTISVNQENTEQKISLFQENREKNISVMNENLNLVISGSYNDLSDKPKINSVELVGNKTFEDLGAKRLTNSDIELIINSVV